MLRTCGLDRRSYGGFLWPDVGEEIAAPDWNPKPVCGGGLHGLLRGVGSGVYLEWGEALWQVVEVETKMVVWIDGNKVKVPRGRVLYCGDRHGALALMAALGHLDPGHVGGTATAGVGGTITIRWWDDRRGKYRVRVAEVGEDGIVAGGKYQLNAEGKFVRVEREG